MNTASSSDQIKEFFDGYPATLKVSDVARILCVSDSTIRRLCRKQKENNIPCVRIGRDYRFYKPVFLDWYISIQDGRHLSTREDD